MNKGSSKFQNIIILLAVAIAAGIVGFFIGKGVMANQQEASLFHAAPTPAGISYSWHDGGCYYNYVDSAGNSQSQITDITSKRKCHAIHIAPVVNKSQ